MSAAASARLATPHASRYLQQLCKHWAHNLEVEFDSLKGRVVFPRNARGADWVGDAVVSFTADDAFLECLIEASEPGQLAGLEGAVVRHLERFAFREAPITLDWK